jgi:hypothetical protein
MEMMTWINPEAWMRNLDNKPINIKYDTKIKSLDDYLKENFFYKFGELFRTLVGTKFMCYEGDELVTKTIKEIKFNPDIVVDEKRKKYVEGKNKFVAMHELPMPNDYTGYKIFVFVISEDDVQYNFNEIYLKPEK